MHTFVLRARNSKNHTVMLTGSPGAQSSVPDAANAEMNATNGASIEGTIVRTAGTIIAPNCNLQLSPELSSSETLVWFGATSGPE